MTKIDWCNRSEVIAYCKRLGKGNVVVKRAGRNNYNITHECRINGAEVVYRA